MERIEPDLARVVAPNPSPYTADGTNTWILGGAEVCVIDPGPDDARHLAALAAALDGRRVAAIVVTHAHRDHSGLALALSTAVGAPVLAFGDAGAGCRHLPASVGGGWGVDRAFRPDRTVADGEALEGDGWRLVARHTPGHMGNHLCLDDGRRLFTGDHAMGFATSLVSPPEGDMGDYMASLRKLADLGPRVLMPGHGPVVADGARRIADLVRHRASREGDVLAALSDGPQSARSIAEAVYPEALRAPARRTILAHLIDLARRGLVEPQAEVSEDGPFRRV